MSFEDTFESWRRAKRSASLLSPASGVAPKILAETAAQTAAAPVCETWTQTASARLEDSWSQTPATTVSSKSTQSDGAFLSEAEQRRLVEAGERAGALELLVQSKELDVRRLSSFLKRERRAARVAQAEVQRLRQALSKEMGSGDSYTDAALDVELCIEEVERLCGRDSRTDALASALASERRRSEDLQKQFRDLQCETAELRTRLAKAEGNADEQRTLQTEALIYKESLRETREELESCREELRVVQDQWNEERVRCGDAQKEAESAHVKALTAAAEMESALERCSNLNARCRSLEDTQRVMEARYKDELHCCEARFKQLETESAEGAQQLQTVTNLVVLELAPLFLSLQPCEGFNGRDLYNKLEKSAAARNVSLLRDVVAASVKSIEQRIRRADVIMEQIRQIAQKGSEWSLDTQVFPAFLAPCLDRIDSIERRISRMCVVLKKLSSMVHTKNDAIHDAKEGCLVAEHVIETLRDEMLDTEEHLEKAIRSRLELARQVELLKDELAAEKTKASASLSAAREAVAAAQRIQKRWQVEAFARSLDLEKQRAKIDQVVAPS